MIVTIMQPAYLPWLGYFDRIVRSDLCVVLDHVQFEKNGFTNRNKLRTASGWTWLTVPLKTSGRFGELAINTLETSPRPDWRRKHWDTIRFNYAKARFFEGHASYLEGLYAQQWPQLCPLLREMTAWQLRELGIATPLVSSSEVAVAGQKSELILNLCRHFHAKTYISGPFGRSYLDRHLFEEAGISVLFHDYRHPNYRQAYPGFESNMATFDLLLNAGPESLDTLSQGQELSSQW